MVHDMGSTALKDSVGAPVATYISFIMLKATILYSYEI
jgi:hypothetical protein